MQTYNLTNIHCKVQYESEFRRFFFKGSQFRSLYEQVLQMFGLSNSSELVLKYTDEEGDLVTISSDEELNFAVNMFRNLTFKLKLVISNFPIVEDNKSAGREELNEIKPIHFSDRASKRSARKFKNTEEKQTKKNVRCKKNFKSEKRNSNNNDLPQWKQKLTQKYEEHPEIVAKKLENLQVKKQWMTTRMQERKSDSSKPFNSEHIEKQLKRIESRIQFLSSFNQKEETKDEPVLSAKEVPICPTPTESLPLLSSPAPPPVYVPVILPAASVPIVPLTFDAPRDTLEQQFEKIGRDKVMLLKEVEDARQAINFQKSKLQVIRDCQIAPRKGRGCGNQSRDANPEITEQRLVINSEIKALKVVLEDKQKKMKELNQNLKQLRAQLKSFKQQPQQQTA